MILKINIDCLPKKNQKLVFMITTDYLRRDRKWIFTQISDSVLFLCLIK